MAQALTQHIKHWADPWGKMPGETKGGMVNLTYDIFIVTSQYSIDQCWETPEDREAMTRRFTVIDFKPEYLEYHPGKVFNFN